MAKTSSGKKITPVQEGKEKQTVVVIQESKRGGSLKRTLYAIAFFAIVAVVVGLAISSRLNEWLAPTSAPVAVIDEMTEEEKAELLKDKKVEIQNIVLGEARQRKELLVLEQDVQVVSLWETTWGNIDLFKKSQEVTSYGTGYYTVDLSGILADAIEVDHGANSVTIHVPHAILKSMSVDEGKTEFGETQRGLLGFGDIKLTLAQRSALEAAVEESMKEELLKAERLTEADTTAAQKIAEIYQPLINAVAPGFVVQVKVDAPPVAASTSVDVSMIAAGGEVGVSSSVAAAASATSAA